MYDNLSKEQRMTPQLWFVLLIRWCCCASDNVRVGIWSQGKQVKTMKWLGLLRNYHQTPVKNSKWFHFEESSMNLEFEKTQDGTSLLISPKLRFSLYMLPRFLLLNFTWCLLLICWNDTLLFSTTHQVLFGILWGIRCPIKPLVLLGATSRQRSHKKFSR